MMVVNGLRFCLREIFTTVRTSQILIELHLLLTKFDVPETKAANAHLKFFKL